MEERDIIRKVVTNILVIVSTVCIAALVFTISIIRNRNLQIEKLKEQNVNLHDQMELIREEIKDIGWADRVENLDWDPTEPVKEILSFSPDRFYSMEDILIEEKAEEEVRSYLKEMIKDIDFVGSVTVDKIPDELANGYIPEGSHKYDVIFWVDIEYQREAMSEGVEGGPKSDQLNIAKEKHNLYGLE